MKYVLAAMHRIGQDWAHTQGWPTDSYRTVTSTHYLRGLAGSVEIHVVDSKVAFQDSSAIKMLLERRFTNVHRHQL